VEIAPFKHNLLAAVTISADFELAWAFRGRGESLRDLYGKRTRENVPYLLDLFDNYSIPITWATVGHLFLERCTRGKDNRAHPDMPRPLYNTRFNGDWYKHDPCTDFVQDPLWYCPDLIKNIVERKVAHEIGSHSFSHIDFSPNCSDPQLIEEELNSCIEVMKPFHLVPRSLVFPYNHSGISHLETIAGCGIIAVRHRDEKIALSYPYRTNEGVYILYESMNTRRSKSYDYVQKAKVLISEAEKRNYAYHLWFHPSDPKDIFEHEFRSIVQYIAGEQKRGSIWVATMTELAAYCEARRLTSIKMETTDNTITLRMSSTFNNTKYPCSEITILVHKDLSNYSLSCKIRECEFDYPFEYIKNTYDIRGVKLTVPCDTQEIIFRKKG
jgi:peptidoglycan/xylan/chitin deacetylase (PgdA/CDA1 family)